MNLTQEEVSEESGLHVTHISELEQGRGNPTHQTIQGLAKGMEIPSSYILVLEDIFEKPGAREGKGSLAGPVQLLRSYP